MISYWIYELGFWSACAAIVFIYIGYPLALALLSLFLTRRVKKDDAFKPFLTIVVSAFNEREHICATIENKLALDYPADKLEIIVTSDGSTDGTDDIVQSFVDRGVRYIRQEPRQGKSAALNKMVAEANGEIVVVSDANSIYEKDAVGKLVRNFADPCVGYVTGKMIYVNEFGSRVGSGCTAYMTYENYLRELETRVGSVIGVDGGIDAFRKSLFVPLAPGALPDFVVPLQVIQGGNRVIYEKDALLQEATLADPSDEWRMRVRVILRSFHALYSMKALLNPFRFPLISFQIMSHKVLRYMVGIFQICALGFNVGLASTSIFYLGLLALHFLFYLLAIMGSSELVGRFVPGATHAFYFCLLNASALSALVRFVKGDEQVVWTPRRG
jgi:cellulose synthase/poly-beta-1,6-N-acetylglucosamine synthase-like glycosyltransferase